MASTFPRKLIHPRVLFLPSNFETTCYAAALSSHGRPSNKVLLVDGGMNIFREIREAFDDAMTEDPKGHIAAAGPAAMKTQISTALEEISSETPRTGRLGSQRKMTTG
ncbi:hypothetical protein OIU77_019650 [Salix suchowensis]|uniref:Uncharacterized protein n=1 Tax=Salix suchowensis TaxID=1278906 RepID=A0ABQ9CGX6_9ROSI|nr:hypothetical protein OIU77_019650 [Salix suchowensis]